MCQAFDSEYSFILRQEKNARAEGYKAFSEKKQLDDNPFTPIGQLYQHNAWKLGWEMAQVGIPLW